MGFFEKLGKAFGNKPSSDEELAFINRDSEKMRQQAEQWNANVHYRKTGDFLPENTDDPIINEARRDNRVLVTWNKENDENKRQDEANRRNIPDKIPYT